MATGGLDTTLAVAGESTKPDNKISLEKIPFSTASKKYKAKVWKVQKKLHEQDELTDVMLVAEGHSIPCHKVLLSAASHFFYDKFVVHPESLEHNLLYMEGIDFETLKDIVYFVHNGRVEPTLKKVEKLIPASVSLMLPELTSMCIDFLIHIVQHDTSACIDIHRVAKANSLIEIADKAWEVMIGHFQELSKLNAFREMSETDLQDYISDVGLNVANEDPVFEALVTWVRHDVNNRKSSFEKLMENVKLSHCSLQFLGEVVRKEPLMKTGNCLEHLSDALYHQATSPQPCDTARIGFYNTLIAVYDDRVYTLKAGESEWVRKISSPRDWLAWNSACMTRDGIVVTGGCRDWWPRQCWKLTLPTMKWTAMPDLNVAHYDHATVRVGNQVYVLGREANGTTAVECLDEQNKAWHYTCNIPFGNSAHTAVSYKHFIYVFDISQQRDWMLKDDGFDHPFTIYTCTIPKRLQREMFLSKGSCCYRMTQTNNKKTFMLDTVSKKWSTRADMPGYCCCVSSVVYRDRIYVLGGVQNCCMSYDPDQDQWESHSNPAVEHVRPSAVVWKDRILLCGGVYTSVIEEYNPDTDTWSQWKHQLPIYSSNPPAVFAIHM